MHFLINKKTVKFSQIENIISLITKILTKRIMFNHTKKRPNHLFQDFSVANQKSKKKIGSKQMLMKS